MDPWNLQRRTNGNPYLNILRNHGKWSYLILFLKKVIFNDDQWSSQLLNNFSPLRRLPVKKIASKYASHHRLNVSGFHSSCQRQLGLFKQLLFIKTKYLFIYLFVLEWKFGNLFYYTFKILVFCSKNAPQSKGRLKTHGVEKWNVSR